MPVADWMSQNVVTVRDDESLLDTRQVMREHKVGRLPVMDKNDRLVGDRIRPGHSGRLTIQGFFPGCP